MASGPSRSSNESPSVVPRQPRAAVVQSDAGRRGGFPSGRPRIPVAKYITRTEETTASPTIEDGGKGDVILHGYARIDVRCVNDFVQNT